MLAAIMALLIIAPHNSDPWIAIPMGGDCSYQLLDMGYRGVPWDNSEQVYAPESVVNNVCG